MLIKQTKTQVEAEIRKNGSWTGWFCPSKSYPNIGHPFNVAIQKVFTKTDLEPTEIFKNEFEKTWVYFQQYNCNTETGWKVHFYKQA